MRFSSPDSKMVEGLTIAELWASRKEPAGVGEIAGYGALGVGSGRTTVMEKEFPKIDRVGSVP
jgi:hypothetical protein